MKLTLRLLGQRDAEPWTGSLGKFP